MDQTLQLLPNAHFPPEILKIIVDFLDDDAVETCSSVSKQWYSNIPLLLTSASSELLFYRKFLFPSYCNVTKLRIDSVDTKKSSRLVRLTNLKELVTGSEEFSARFWKHVASLTKLESLQMMATRNNAIYVLQRLTNLKHLDMRINEEMSDESDDEISYDYFDGICRCEDDAWTSVTKLFMTVQKLTRLERLVIDIGELDCTANQLEMLPTTLTKLVFYALSKRRGVLDPCLPLHISALTNLEELRLYFPCLRLKYTTEQWDTLFKPLVKLRSLAFNLDDHFILNDEIASSTFIQQLQAIHSCVTLEDVTIPLKNITYLRMFRVNAADMNYISRLTTLKELRIQNIKEPELLFHLTALTRLRILDALCKDKELIAKLPEKLVNLVNIR